MKQLSLYITESKFQAFLEFIRTLDYVEIQEDDTIDLDGLQRSLHQVKMIREGKIEKHSADEYLNGM